MQYSNTCVKCGKICAVRKDVLLKRIVKHGSLEKLNAEYECQKCRSKNSEADLNKLANELKEAIAAEKAQREEQVAIDIVKDNDVEA